MKILEKPYISSSIVIDPDEIISQRQKWSDEERIVDHLLDWIDSRIESGRISKEDVSIEYIEQLAQDILSDKDLKVFEDSGLYVDVYQLM